jgi:translation elongation factor EF-Tu-like GTPase
MKLCLKHKAYSFFRQVGFKNIILFLNNFEIVQDEEIHNFVEIKVRNLLSHFKEDIEKIV